MENVLVSVVVPAYNNAPWLPRCLDSLLSQTHRNLEILVVDDGSTDDTRQVLQEYTSRDPRVVAIHKANGGVTSARLRGVSAAHGEWIGFVDADDEAHPQMYARLLENAREYGAQISHCGYQVIHPDGRVEYLHNTKVLRPQDNTTGLRDLLEDKLVEPGLCSKLFRRELFRGLEEKMDLTIRNNEDLLMNYYLFSAAKASVFEDVCYYHYLIRKGSASRRKLNEHMIFNPIRVREIIMEDVPEELRDDARRSFVQACLAIYGQLVLEKDAAYGTYRRQVREIIVRQKECCPVLSRRNALLVRMIDVSPWLFRILYPVYAKLTGR